jgi:hypothetical protein
MFAKIDRSLSRDTMSLASAAVAQPARGIVGIATDGGRQELGLDDLGEALVVLHELGGRETGREHAVRELIPRDDLGELGQEGGAGASSIPTQGAI